ncbi:hypothetical protein K474DRAFT_1510905 [Panus rudis PR-1116 ss-1]|nr:hypothetical protein K474DRAFT_1510905 [Panus rudis PR-1116 ss-1]
MALVAAPAAHRIHTIHGSFGPSFSVVPSAASSLQASAFNSLPNVSYSSQGRAAGISRLNARTATPVATTPSSSSHLRNQSLFTPRRRSTTISMTPVVTRRAPPPPPPAARSEPFQTEEDPFADIHCASDRLVVSLPNSRPHRTAVPSQSRVQHQQQRVSYTPPNMIIIPPAFDFEPITPRPPSERRAAKLVANVLLSRACGRPMRRRPVVGERQYVKSCLSREVAVEA